MIRKFTLILAMLVFLTLAPQANASFTKAPTFDLITSSSLVGATDAVYTLHLENPDQSEDAASVSITIPAGYAIDQQFITSMAGIQAGSGYGSCPNGSADIAIATTTTPGQFSIFISGISSGLNVAQVILSQPSVTNTGKIDLTFTSPRYSIVNHGCSGELVWAKGFFRQSLKSRKLLLDAVACQSLDRLGCSHGT
jgi:hypothetical protein